MGATERGPGRGPDEPAALAAVGRELRAPAAAGVAGLLFAALFTLAIALLYRQPPKGGTAAEIAAWYLRHNAKIVGLVGLYLAPFAGIAFLWFVATVRHHIGVHEDRFFATVFLASGVLFVAMLYVAAASAGASFGAIKFQAAPAPSPDVLVFSRGLAYTLLFVYGMRAAAVFMVVSSTIGLRTGTFPRWLAFVGYVVALVLLFSVSYSRGFVFVFPGWVTLVSIELLLRARSQRAEERGTHGAATRKPMFPG